MTDIVSWADYSAFHSKVTETDFPLAEELAELEVSLVVGYYRWSNIDGTEFFMNQLKECICKVIDKMTEDKASGIGKGIASASNDGYSEAYVIQTSSQLKEELQTSIKMWLSGTGLVGAM